jgi:hypothetical protein
LTPKTVRRYGLTVQEDESVRGVMHMLCESLDLDFVVIMERPDGRGTTLVEVTGSRGVLDLFEGRYRKRNAEGLPPFRRGVHAKIE